MKLRNTLIVTLPDFSRQFNFPEFWENRRQFVRDMHPDKVYYWSETLKEAYRATASWIRQGENATEADKTAGLKGLETLIGRKLTPEEILADARQDFTAPILRVPSGQTLTLPECTADAPGSLELRFHKIEVYGKSPKGASDIRIGDSRSLTLAEGEFAYVTACHERFIEFMPTHLQDERFDLRLYADAGDFKPTLYAKDLSSQNLYRHEGAISFALTADGYVYIDAHKELCIESLAINPTRFLLKAAGEALYVKARDKDALVLYADGVLKTNTGSSYTRILSAEINEGHQLTYIKV